MFRLQAIDGKASVNTETLTDNKTLTTADHPIQILDPGGSARTITLPTATDAVDGKCYWIKNSADAAEIITVADADSNTIGTPTQNETGLFLCVDGTWYGLVGSHV